MEYEVWKKYNESISLEDCPGEEWREIEGYPHYRVSNYGRIKRLAYEIMRSNGKSICYQSSILRSHLNHNGYPIVTLNPSRGKSIKIMVHRLIAIAFISNTENKSCIDHANMVKTDNRIENLSWVTRAENNNNPLTRQQRSSISKQIMSKQSIRDKISNTLKKYKFTDEHRKHISEAGKRRFENPLERAKVAEILRRSEYTVERRARIGEVHSKPVLHYDENGVLIERFVSVRAASIALKLNEETVRRWLKGTFIPRNKHIWKYAED